MAGTFPIAVCLPSRFRMAGPGATLVVAGIAGYTLLFEKASGDGLARLQTLAGAQVVVERLGSR